MRLTATFSLPSVRLKEPTGGKAAQTDPEKLVYLVLMLTWTEKNCITGTFDKTVSSPSF